MIIGGSRKEVIKNIKIATEKKEYNSKVEIGDPNIPPEREEELIKKYFESQGKLSYKIKTKMAELVIGFGTAVLNYDTKIEGIENAKNIETGALITSNHFNPLDNLAIHKLIKKLGKKRAYIVSQVSNLDMTGFVGFMMNYSNIIPISKQVGFMKKDFSKLIKSKLDEKEYILIYPEEEMWINYRKPRPEKQGAYYFAAKNNVPIISCFIELIDTDKDDNDEFYKVKYVVHVLKTIYPNPDKSVKENSIEMMNKDYKQKVEAYEKAYNKKLDYTFDINDIAGWKQK